MAGEAGSSPTLRELIGSIALGIVDAERRPCAVSDVGTGLVVSWRDGVSYDVIVVPSDARAVLNAQAVADLEDAASHGPYDQERDES